MAPFKPPTCTDEYPMSGCSGHDANGSLCRLMIQSGHHSGGQHAVLWKSILLNRSLLYEGIARVSLETVARKLFGDIGLNRLCRTDVDFTTCVFAFLELGETAPIERAR